MSPFVSTSRGEAYPIAGYFRIFNPCSPTDNRRQPHRTLGVLEIEYGHLTRAEIVTLPCPRETKRALGTLVLPADAR
jgi:hypothetical protein